MYDTYRSLPLRSWTINNIERRKNDDNNKQSSLLLLIDSFIPTYSIQYSADTQAVVILEDIKDTPTYIHIGNYFHFIRSIYIYIFT
mmetsp:Transcript_18302/g.18506  ORF Transcript_18302/g.18506 Transcript_18302/m.18506 type:complete len:86 (+) Transcript_18302:604-861(+)